MSIEVFLMADVKDLGEEGSVVTVADGYARNFLLPKNLAAPVTDATKRKLEKIRRDRAAELESQVAGAKELAAKLAEVSLTIAVKTGEEGHIFGSVTTADVAKALGDQSIEIDKQKIVLDEPIKELGVFDLPVKIHPDVEAAVKVWVVEE